MQFGFYTDLRGVRFHEGNSTWIQAMPVGKYKHPIFGEISFTEERVQRFTDNVNNNVVGTDLDIDYDHKMFTGKAAGWVRRAENRGPAGLHILVEFTSEAATAIRNGEYRYFSPEFADEWTHPKTAVKHQDVLRGGGLTNRPFLKDILPVNLSELSFEIDPGREKGVTPKELRDALGLAETATDDEVRAKLKTLSEPPKQDDDPTAKLMEQLNKLSQENPAVKALTDQLAQQGEQIKTMEQQIKLAEVNRKLEAANKGKLVLAPSVRDSFAKILLGEDVAAAAEAFLKALSEGNAIVETGERGAVDPTQLGETDAEKQWDQLIAKLMADQKLDYAAACEEAARQNPKLFSDYREASTAFKA